LLVVIARKKHPEAFMGILCLLTGGGLISVNLLPIKMGFWKASARRPQSGVLKLPWIEW
jgi:hypothetical protein